MPAIINSSNPKPTEWAVRWIAHDTPARLVAGQPTTVNLHIENVGKVKWQHSGGSPVHIGYKWLTPAGAQALDVEDRRTGLPCDLYPRQQARFAAVLVAPQTPGVYQLQWDLVAAGRAWFADADPPPFVVPVTVTDAPTDIIGWRVESNMNIAAVARALDGDPMTFWDSGAPQARGQWFRLNLASPRSIDGIQFLSPGKGFPVSYALNLSADGHTWLQVARVESENPYDVMSIFAPHATQYAQIDLLGAPSASWKISELLVHPATAWTANASHNAKGASRAIDNRDATAWSSDAPQTQELWFSIDLGHPETISGLTLVSPAQATAASYRVAVWNASANRWHVVAEKLHNAEPVDISFDAIQTQFISVQSLRSSDRPWIIQHARIIREMERWLGPNT
jgi:hypothetical protein